MEESNTRPSSLGRAQSDFSLTEDKDGQSVPKDSVDSPSGPPATASEASSPADNDSKRVASSESKATGRPFALIAVSFKEAALDSPTFRASMNHINDQFESVDRWLESFTKAISRLSQEMDGECFTINVT
ncbi:hypothetical protein TRICI_006148 [Trichomonascus ciferrii]|uniref:Uncharacterized protein n=1 Tax=Trichomonascus ciferrii TaxID=44093 RepID=A0A642UK80_9ASCO|nr:hypothetical protein TRICI_006148 [Trichomonascus ciferrii]